MADTSLLSNNLSGLIPAEISNQIVLGVKKGSFCLSNSRIEPMTTVKKSVPVLANLPGPVWVGEGKKITVVKPQIVPVTLEAKKLAFILTASRETLNDTVLHTFDQLKESIVDAFSVAIDKAIITGDVIEGSPVFTNTLLTVAGKQKVERTTNLIADDIADALAIVEDNGYNASNVLAINSIKNELRKEKTTTKEYLYSDVNNLFGTPINYTNQFDNTKGYAIVGDFINNLMTGIYQDIEYDVLRESTLELGDGTTINLGQADLIGLRVTMRIASNVLREEPFSLVSPTGV
ncbi:hypothetical protein TPDSL_40770 (plasmid) [Terrisporobacter petrolearius]|uniref:phage major capsid protein n=1 Tax=Terrisporobacter petrolearius TaxID=1460447 RepID=UPI00324204BA